MAGTITVGWLTWRAWSGLPIAGEDVMFHLIRADVGIDDLLFRGRLYGWSPRFYLGTDLFLFYGPGFLWLLGLVRLLSFGALDNGAALTMVTLASLLGLPAVMAFMARSLGFHPRIAGLVAVLTPVVSSPYGVGLEGVFGTGLVTQQLGAVWWALAVSYLWRLLSDRQARWITGVAVFTALEAITSPVSFLFLAATGLVAVTIHTLMVGIDRSAIRRLVTAAEWAAALAAFWWIPAVAHRNLAGTATFWPPLSLPELTAQVLEGDLLFPPGVGAAVLIAALWLIRRKPNPASVFLVSLPALYLLAETLVATFNSYGVLSAAIRNHRGLGLVGFSALVPLAWGVDRTIQRLRLGRSVQGIGVAGVAIALAVIALQAPLQSLARPFPEPIPQMRAAAAVLAEVVPSYARFAVTRDWPDEVTRTGVVHPETWLAYASGANLLNGVGLETTRVTRALTVGEELGKAPLEESYRDLVRFGVTHVVATDPAVARRLADSGLFRTIWEDPPVAILSVQPGKYGDPSHQITASGLVSARPTYTGSQRLTLQVTTSRATIADLAVAWSPHWRVSLDGRQVQSMPSPDWMTRVEIPLGNHTLELRYTLDGWERLGSLISLTTLITSIILLATQQRSAFPADEKSRSTK